MKFKVPDRSGLRNLAFGLIAIFCVLTIWQIAPTQAHEGQAHGKKPSPDKKLASIFPKAAKFTAKKASLSKEKAAAIQKELGTKLGEEDLKPTFYIAQDDKQKQIGFALFVNVKGPHGVIDGGVGLDMKGKVVKVEVYRHKESSAIAESAFLKQFIGKSIDDRFKMGEDVKPVAGQEAASQAVALMPKKTLAMSYALFLKKEDGAHAHHHDHDHAHTGHGHDMAEIEDLKALMHVMQESYGVIRDYFKTGEKKADAVKAAQRLGEYAELIPNFEPPKNPNNREEYAYFQNKVHDALHEFAESLEKEGTSEKTKKQWQEIVDQVNKAHLRFSEEKVDLDEHGHEKSHAHEESHAH